MAILFHKWRQIHCQKVNNMWNCTPMFHACSCTLCSPRWISVILLSLSKSSFTPSIKSPETNKQKQKQEPLLQWKQEPQGIIKVQATLPPMGKRLPFTSSPCSTTVPLISWPKTAGEGNGKCFLMQCKSWSCKCWTRKGVNQQKVYILAFVPMIR